MNSSAAKVKTNRMVLMAAIVVFGSVAVLHSPADAKQRINLTPKDPTALKQRIN